MEKIHGNDNIILVHEVIHTSKTRGEKGTIIKLHMANAFDRVKHMFLLEVLQKFGFEGNFLKWVFACLSSPWIAPLVNGHPTPFFRASKGLRQGCPLSPLLYILIVEAFNKSLDHARKEKSIPYINIVRGAKRLNHS